MIPRPEGPKLARRATLEESDGPSGLKTLFFGIVTQGGASLALGYRVPALQAEIAGNANSTMIHLLF
jgi:hypothetical protein